MTEFGGTICDTSNYGYYMPITSRSRPSYTDTSWLTRSERPLHCYTKSLHCYTKSLLPRSSGMGGPHPYFISNAKTHTDCRAVAWKRTRLIFLVSIDRQPR